VGDGKGNSRGDRDVEALHTMLLEVVVDPTEGLMMSQQGEQQGYSMVEVAHDTSVIGRGWDLAGLGHGGAMLWGYEYL